MAPKHGNKPVNHRDHFHLHCSLGREVSITGDVFVNKRPGEVHGEIRHPDHFQFGLIDTERTSKTVQVECDRSELVRLGHFLINTFGGGSNA